MEATSPTSPPPPPVISAWQIKKDQVKSDTSLHLADIVKDELEKSQNLSRTRNKTLHYIQVNISVAFHLLIRPKSVRIGTAIFVK